ncbi:MAG: hypothetical protein WCK98_01700 [bacterium]
MSNDTQPTTSTYLKLVHFVTKNAFVSTIVMFLLLGTLGVSAAQVFAPEGNKPSTILGITKKSENQQSSSQSIVATSSSSSQDSSTQNPVDDKGVIDTGKNWTGKITLRPKDYSKFIKQVNDVAYNESSNKVCGIYGITSYYQDNTIQNNKGLSMTVANYNLDSSRSSESKTSQKEIFDNLLTFIDDRSNPVANTVKPSWYNAFHADCAGYGSEYLYELDNSKINFKNVDKYKAIVTVEGQSLPGQPVILILSKKGDSLIQFRQPLETNSKSCFDKNIDQLKNNKRSGYIDCISTPEFKQLAQNTSTELVNAFELDESNFPSNVAQSSSSSLTASQNNSSVLANKLQTYTNPYFPNFKLVYPDGWKFETTTSKSSYSGLLERKILLKKNGVVLLVNLYPKTTSIGFGGGGTREELIQKFNNGTAKYRFTSLDDNSAWISYGYENNRLASNINIQEVPDYKKDFPSDKAVEYFYGILAKRDTTNNATEYPPLEYSNPLVGELDQIISQSAFN